MTMKGRSVFAILALRASAEERACTHTHAMGWRKEIGRREPSARMRIRPATPRCFFLQLLQNALLGSFDVRFRFFHVDGRPVAVAVEHAPVHHGEHDVGTMACVHGV